MKKIFGSNPQTTLVGYVLAGLLAAQTVMGAGVTHWYDIAIPVGIAVLGRVSGDSKNAQP